ncbi:MAG: Beta-glucuronidase [Bacteroidetes bacterium ADurb.Bin123]|nr:MAG: Beta-glucuronidase [Bacteroidetes bacterium ADurb.Bin123]
MTIMKISLVFIALALLLFGGCRSGEELSLNDLSGEWRFATDPDDQGIEAQWFRKPLKERITLPGSMASNGKGDKASLSTVWTGQIVDSSFFKNPEYAPFRVAENFKIPFWLQPVRHYVGPAWYQKEISIPEGWKEKNISLVLERCHWETRLWVDDREAGMRNSLGTPHIYDLTGLSDPGKHTLTIRVDNRIREIDPGINSHSISDHTQTNWNGITGKILLETRPAVFIRNMQLYPDIQGKRVEARITLVNSGNSSGKISLKTGVNGPSIPPDMVTDHEIEPGENSLIVLFPMGNDFKTWDEFHPHLYLFTAVVTPYNSATTHTFRSSFGMRELAVRDGQMLINGNPLFLRGTLECAIFPKTGYPPTDEGEWMRIFTICRAHGLNHMRFHSWCPPEAAFSAADKAGFYLQAECSSWANQSTSLGDGKPFDNYLYQESERMVEAYGNHPSFCMMAYGNEPRGRNQNLFLTKFVNYWKEKDNRRLYLSGAGWPNLEANDYLSMSEPRIQRWGEELTSIINASPPSTDYDWADRIKGTTQPVVSHEIGQWCVYPDFKEISQYDGVLRARNFEIFRESLARNGMGHLADSFLMASGKLQALCYKADIEAALRTPGFGGFQLLDLHDFPGQGTALVGVLNAFWEEKGYIPPEEFSRFCNSTVPLVRMKKMIYTNTEAFEASEEVAHFGENPLKGYIPEWEVSDTKGTTLLKGRFPETDIPLGNGIPLGKISFPLKQFVSAQKLTLVITIGPFANSWDFWIFPGRQETMSGENEIRMVRHLDDQTREYLQNGGTVLLNLKKGTLSPEAGGNIKTGFSSIFWNTAWTSGQGPHTLGILCNPDHPAFADFPAEFHSNWQWWDAMHHGSAINLAYLPDTITPILRVIDDWFTNRPLALLFEARVGKGRVLVSGIDLETGIENRPDALQLLRSLKKYMTGPNFNPHTEINPEILTGLVR